jgi:hypothetical protein
VRSPLPSRLAAAAFAAVAAFHAVALVAPGVAPPSPAWRHALFVVVNGAYAVGFAVRPRWLFVAFLLLAVQQVVSHGAAFVNARAEGWVDWQSLVVLGSLPLLGWIAHRAGAKRSS